MIKIIQHVDSKPALVRVAKAAEEMGVSRRRVRVLLQQGRLLGEKTGGLWFANYPLRLSEGRRGPKIGFNKPRSVPCMPERSEGIKTATPAGREAATDRIARGSAEMPQSTPLQTGLKALNHLGTSSRIDQPGKEVETVP